MKTHISNSRASRFSHGNDVFRYHSEIIADFSTNTWYLGPDKSLLQLVKDEVEDIDNYPEPQAESLTALIADYHHLAPDQVLVCNGTADAIFYIARQYQKESSRIITPTFSEYEHACMINEHEVSFCGANFVAAGMQTPQGLFWLCNPNNPTGQVFDKEVLLDLLKRNPQTLFVIDEAYSDFCIEDISMVSFVGKFKNLLILKSLTKNHCLPGLRLGYILGHQQPLKQIAQQRAPWSVNSLALKAGEYALNHPRITNDELISYIGLSHAFRRELSGINGFEVLTSSTGYFLVKTPMLSSELKTQLVEEHGILIRDASNFRTLSDYHIRLATLTRDKNEKLIRALKTIFE